MDTSRTDEDTDARAMVAQTNAHRRTFVPTGTVGELNAAAAAEGELNAAAIAGELINFEGTIPVPEAGVTGKVKRETTADMPKVASKSVK